MLKSLSITNFRCFPKYHMPGLARVNLLVGKNNSGKTAVLEAVQFLVEGGDPYFLAEAAKRRGEIRLRNEQSVGQVADLSHAFFRRRFGLGSSIQLQDDLAHIYSVLSLEPYTSEGRHSIVFPKDFVPVFSLVPNSSVINNKSVAYALDNDGFFGYSLTARVYSSDEERDEARKRRLHNSLFLDSGLQGSEKLGSLWKDAVEHRREKLVLESLKLLDAGLEDVMFVGSTGLPWEHGRDGFLAGIRDEQKRFPLGSRGEGIWRMLTIGVGIAHCQDATLFVDEIDSGLHYSLFEDFWAYVVRMAVDLNVQVFATTHSNDCLQALGSLCESKPELAAEVAVHKLNAGFDTSVPISGEKLPAVLYGGAEIR